MTIERRSPVEWEVVMACGDWNTSFEVEVTAKGIQVNYNLITWEELADARRFFIKEEQSNKISGRA